MRIFVLVCTIVGFLFYDDSHTLLLFTIDQSSAHKSISSLEGVILIVSTIAIPTRVNVHQTSERKT